MSEQLPIWLNPGVEPPNSLKTNGWQPGMKPSAQHMNWLFNRAYMALKEIQEGGGFEEIEQRLGNVEDSLSAHLEASMPHTFVDNGVTYRWGFRTVNGEPQMIYEEVTT